MVLHFSGAVCFLAGHRLLECRPAADPLACDGLDPRDMSPKVSSSSNPFGCGKKSGNLTVGGERRPVEDGARTSSAPSVMLQDLLYLSTSGHGKVALLFKRV